MNKITLSKLKMLCHLIVLLLVMSGAIASVTAQEVKTLPLAETITPDNAGRLTQMEVLEESAAVNSMAFSPDGATLAVGSGDGWVGSGSVSLWDVATRTEIARHDHALWVRSVTFSPDGSLLASGSGDSTVSLWDTATWESRFTIEGLNDPAPVNLTITDDDGITHRPTAFSDAVWSVAFSPDSTTLAVGRGDPWVGPGSLQLYDVATGQMLADVRPEHVNGGLASVSVYDVAFSPDGTYLAFVNGYSEVELREVSSFDERATLSTGVGWYATRIVFSPDGALLAGGGGATNCDGWVQSCGPNETKGVIRLWDVATCEQVAALKGLTGGVQAVAFSPNGKILASAGGIRGTVQLWDVVTEKQLVMLSSPSVSSIAFSPNGTLMATGGWDGMVRLWGVQSE